MATIARAGSPLTCLATNHSDTRLYLVTADSSVGELAKAASGWRAKDFSGLR